MAVSLSIPTFTVSGHIFDQFNAPVANAKVQAFDKDLRSEQVLGEKITDAAGMYSITFSSLAAIARESKTPDVFIRVFDSTGKPLGQSPVYFNIPASLTIDFKEGNTEIKSLNEFDALVQLLQPLVSASNLRLKDLVEKAPNHDISFLAGETGEDFQKITSIKTAFSFSNETHIEPDVFYGLFRMGFPAVLNELLLIKSESIKKALQQAMDENIISSKWQKKLGEIIKIFNALAVTKVVDGNDEQSASFKKLFGSSLSADQQKIFTATYFDNEDTPENFWDKLKQQPGFSDGATVEKTKQLLSLNLLTGNQPELAQHLFSKQSSDPDLKEMNGYAKFSKADWKQQITTAAVSKFPAWVKGETTEEKTGHYAESLEQLHKQIYPTTFFAARMKQDGQSSFSLKEELNIFFSKNPGFELNTKNIQKQFEGASFENITDKDAIKKELKTLNRLYKLTDDYKQVNELYSQQLFSSADIVKNYGREQFVTQFSGITGGAGNAALLYKKAVSVNNKTTALITGYKTRHDIKVYAIDGDNTEPAGYHEMFADRELCECEHCQSVYSPAAYFVDMLQFIKDRNEAAFNELLRRRPDLKHILLTCKNTNTPLPYIDLVNELLEKEVAAVLLPEGDARNAVRDQSFQTEGTAAELIAMPEHINSDAYGNLKTVAGNAVFSALLPLDLPLEEIRAYTEKLGWKRYELMDSFYGNNEPGRMNDANLAAELFGFSDAELKLINGSNAFTVTIPVDATRKPTVNLLLAKTKLSYIDLLQLLETHFLNPVTDGVRLVQITQVAEGNGEQLLTCDLNKLFLTGASHAWLNKVVRFVRLWKKTGWDIFDLDRTLTILGIEDFLATETAFNEQLLVPLGHIEKIKRLLNIPVRQVITFFGNIDTAVYLDHTKEGQPVISSLYQQVFQDKTVIGDLSNSPFNATAENLTGVLMDHAEPICAVLGITATEFALLDPAAQLSIQNISRLYGDVLLARSLKASIADVKEISKITGKGTSTGTWSPVLLSQFLEEWEIFKSSGIKANEFYSIITNNTGAGYQLPVNSSLIEFVQQNIDALNTIKNDTANTEEQRKEKYAERLNQFLNALSENDELMNALAGSLSSQDDNALKNNIQNYLGDKNKEALHLLSGGELIEKLGKLKISLSDYLFLKTTPQIFKQFRFLPAEVKWLEGKKVTTGTGKLWEGMIDITDVGLYPAFRRLLHIWLIAKIKTDATLSWTELFDIAVGAGTKAQWFDKCISLYAVAESSLLFLCGSKDQVNNKGQLNFSFPEDYIRAENLLALLNCSRIIEKLGGNDDQLRALLNTSVLAEDAQAVKSLLKSKYGNKEWLGIIKPINDRLRTRRRDALVAWLLANTNGGAWHSTNDMYEWLLIDTEMDACMVTSRIKQGISSIQLFIDRCLMNLETTLNLATPPPDDIKKIILGKEFSEQWHDWRKQYRVWEANRKIFLYPENWIEPELRDDKSPFFKELESQLKQNEVTEETAKEALITYLHKLDTVANLEMVGLFNDEEAKIVHVFGRTQNIPHQYFWRKQENSVWSAWEKVEVDIEGDHILPVVWNGRLMLFWAQFTKKQVETGGSTLIKPEGDSGSMTMSSNSAPKYLEMKLAWTEYKNHKWGPKKVSKEVWSSLDLDNIQKYDTDVKRISLYSEILSDNLLIGMFLSNRIEENKIWRMGIIFEFDSCNSYPKNKKIGLSSVDYRTPLNTFFNKMKIASSNVNQRFIISENGFYTTGNSPTSPIVLKKSRQFEVLASHHESLNQKPLLFFYANNKDCFYVASNEKVKPFSSIDILADSTSILARKIVETPERIINTGAIDRRENSNSLIPVLVNSELDATLSPIEIATYWFFQGRKYLFQTFYHPFVCTYIKILNSKGIDSLYQKDIQNKEPKTIFTTIEYDPTDLVLKPYPKHEVDFSYIGSYSIFNWELFYHIPLLIATRLTQNQKFEEARKWFHYIFDPTKSPNDKAGAERFWITKPFREEIEEGLVSLEDLLNNPENADELDVQLTNWEKNPFNPHAVARLRISAYMRNTVLRYIDNLIQWGDQLFRRDTIESINEATLLYILASNILGKRLATVPPRAKPSDQSFSDIKEKLDRFSNVKAEIESFISPSSGDDNILMPYFCLPKNDYLLKYWDTVADRLFKIRHCMNIEGVARQLPLFEPPIDPALLVRATAAGLDLNTILDDMNAGLPNYRFQVMLQQANELCNDVKSLGSSLLSALEKKDGEEMALLRSAHELKMLDMIKDIKGKQRDEAEENLNSLQASRITVEERLSYYNKNVSAYLNPSERLYFDLTNQAINIQTILEMKNYMASVLAFTPEFKLGSGFTLGSTFGGSNLGRAADFAANALQSIASLNRLQAETANMKGSYDRRMDEWKFQFKTAELELKQIDKQIIAAEIRLAITEKDVENHDLQMEQSKEVDDYMQGKFTNTELYDWMVGQLSTVYFQSYQLAYSTAKKAEKCLQHELGLEVTNYVQFGYWDSLKKGLLSGEKLQYDLRRLENAYLEENKREYEIVKHVSLIMLDPLSIVKLRSTGSCDFEIPEVLYDMDHAGHYFRRLKSVSVSLPCIAGPYTSVSAKLSLNNSRYRWDKNAEAEYVETPASDTRFIYKTGPIQSIATSHAQNDSGVFELNFRDERYLPFEGAGAVSQWQLELPSAVRQFDYNTISDVIIHVKYTAREANELKERVNDSLTGRLNEIAQQLGEQGLHIAINMKHDLSNEWHQLKSNGQTNLKLDKSRLPYIAQTLVTEIENVICLVRAKDNPDDFGISVNGTSLELLKIDDTWLLCKGIIPGIELDTIFSLSVAEADRDKIEELIIIVKYSI